MDICAEKVVQVRERDCQGSFQGDRAERQTQWVRFCPRFPSQTQLREFQLSTVNKSKSRQKLSSEDSLGLR